MTILYCIAGAYTGWMIPEFIKALSPRAMKVPMSMNLMCAFAGAVIIHMILFA